MHKRYLLAITLGLLLKASPGNTAPTSECFEHARAPLERSYCEIKAAGQGHTLPSLHEFRKAGEKMQRLILLKPAAKAKITLPETKKKAIAKMPSIEDSMPQTEAVKDANAEEISVSNFAQIQAIENQAQTQNQNKGTGLDNCELYNNKISCEGFDYLLQNNLNNTKLATNALGTNNRLALPSPEAEIDTAFLSRAYRRYIEKMLDIGLGAATMSFTKFANTYQNHIKNGVDANERFATMYELLKNERKTNVIKSRYSEALPEKLSQCMGLSERIVVCDNIQENWVYVH